LKILAYIKNLIFASILSIPSLSTDLREFLHQTQQRTDDENGVQHPEGYENGVPRPGHLLVQFYDQVDQKEQEGEPNRTHTVGRGHFYLLGNFYQRNEINIQVKINEIKLNLKYKMSRNWIRINLKKFKFILKLRGNKEW